MPHSMQIQVRFNDTDALGHVNNAAFAHYAELGRLHFLRGFALDPSRLILARLEIDFRRQVSFTDNVRVRTAVERIGTSSIHMTQTIFAEEAVAADVTSVVVHFDYQAGKAAPIPDQMREKLTLTPDA